MRLQVTVLCALVALAAAASGPVPFTNCGNKTDLAKVQNLTMTPFPPGTLPHGS